MADPIDPEVLETAGLRRMLVGDPLCEACDGDGYVVDIDDVGGGSLDCHECRPLYYTVDPERLSALVAERDRLRADLRSALTAVADGLRSQSEDPGMWECPGWLADRIAALDSQPPEGAPT